MGFNDGQWGNCNAGKWEIIACAVGVIMIVINEFVLNKFINKLHLKCHSLK